MSRLATVTVLAAAAATLTPTAASAARYRPWPAAAQSSYLHTCLTSPRVSLTQQAPLTYCVCGLHAIEHAITITEAVRLDTTDPVKYLQIGARAFTNC